jgi:hypothetical protein
MINSTALQQVFCNAPNKFFQDVEAILTVGSWNVDGHAQWRQKRFPNSPLDRMTPMRLPVLRLTPGTNTRALLIGAALLLYLTGPAHTEPQVAPSAPPLLPLAGRLPSQPSHALPS